MTGIGLEAGEACACLAPPDDDGCPNCSHTVAEHQAYELGKEHGEEFHQPDEPRNPFKSEIEPTLFHAYETGHSLGTLNRAERHPACPKCGLELTEQDPPSYAPAEITTRLDCDRCDIHALGTTRKEAHQRLSILVQQLGRIQGRRPRFTDLLEVKA